MADERPVVLDTMIFSALAIRGRGNLRELYRPHVEGRRIVLSFQTMGELRFGALNAGWGERRRDELEQRLARITVARATDRVVTAYASLKHELKQQGHGLWAKAHDGDRWIAATAVAYGLPLVTHDAIFDGIRELDLLTELGAEA